MPMKDTKKLPAGLERLEDLLLSIDDDDVMLVSQLDGFLCGVAIGPELVSPATWLPHIWGGDGFDAAAHGVDQGELVSLATERYNTIVRELSLDRYQPIYAIDERHDEVLWEIWIEGFAAAVQLSADAWKRIIEQDSESEAQSAALGLMLLVARTMPDGFDDDPNMPADDIELAALERDAPNLIPEMAGVLYRAHAVAVPNVPVRRPSIGRNDPCPCGSGLKYKRCCGAS